MKKRLGITTFLLMLLISAGGLKAQLYFRVADKQEKQVQVLDSSKETFPYPWAGGMNSCQFGEVDMDLDGDKDLVAFDRMGNRIMPFVNDGQPGIPDYHYAPEFLPGFPELFDWVIFRDYNGDGLEDIFTYAKEYPGIVVYKNVSAANLEFKLEVYPFLTSLQGGGQVNILTTAVDYPGIADIDNDGDLDILTFWGLGSFVEYHQNQSMELYGIPDSLEYVEVTQCWGYFAESDESNTIYLDTCMGQQGSKALERAPAGRHTGSTFLLLDLDGDEDQDLLLGDVDYPGLVGLINGGTTDTAYMTSQDPAFPAYNKPINLFSMPAAAYIDVNNDGLRDLLLSPFDPSPITSVNTRSVWLYQNTGSTEQPHFEFVQQDFLQEGMIDLGSGAYPVLEDYDGDGLMDLFVGNFGYYIYSYYDAAMILHAVYWSNIALFRNTGTLLDPQFTHITHDFANLHALHRSGLFPAFGDLDGDGDKDMITGSHDGTLIYLENTAGPGNPMEFSAPVLNYQGIDAGEYSTPQLFDLDNDGLPDLVIGEKNGNLNYYKNTGTAGIPQFSLVTDSLGKVNVTDYSASYSGYSTPCFFYNPEGEIELITGSEQGKVFYFKDIENNLEGTFAENDSLFVLVEDEAATTDKGIRTGAVIGELNGDSTPELIVGNYSGGLHYYAGTGQPPVSGLSGKGGRILISVYPNPASERLTIRSDRSVEDLVVEVFNVFGQRLIRSEFKNTAGVELDVSGLSPGLHFLRCSPMSAPELVVSCTFLKTGR